MKQIFDFSCKIKNVKKTYTFLLDESVIKISIDSKYYASHDIRKKPTHIKIYSQEKYKRSYLIVFENNGNVYHVARVLPFKEHCLCYSIGQKDFKKYSSVMTVSRCLDIE